MQKASEDTQTRISQKDDDSFLEIDITVLIKAVMTRLKLVGSICGIVFILSLAYCLLKTPIYEAPCRMLVEQGSLKLTNIQDVYNSDMGQDAKGRDTFMQTQKEILTSDHILARVFEHFKMGEREQFANMLEPLKALKELIVIKQVPNTSLLDIAFLSDDARFSAQVANYLATIYMDDSRQRATGFSQRGLEKLQDELLVMEQRRLKDIENLNGYKKEHDIISVEAAQALGIERLTELEKARVAADEALATAQASVAAIGLWRAQGKRLDSIPDVILNPTLTQFKMERLKAQAARMQSQIITEMDAAINREIENSLVSSQAKLSQAQTRVRIISETQAKAHAELMSLDMIADEYRMLEDKLKASENAYRLVLQRVNELHIAKSSDSGAGGTFQILVAATPPYKAAYPQKAKVMVLAMLAAIMFSIMLCIVLELMDNRIQNKNDIEAITRMPIFGLVPYVAKEERREFAALDTPRGQIAEAFRALRISLSLSEASRKAHLLAITSSVTNEGKSFISLNIAFAQAQAGKKVLFVDADMHKHSSTNLLMPQADSQRAGGLSNLLAEALPLNEYASLVTRPVANLSLDFLASGLMPPNPAELLGSSLTAKLCALMLEEYDLVIFDAPPVLNVTDVRTLAAIPEMNFLLVVRMLATEKRQIRSTMEVLQTVGAKVVGSIMNNATAQTESTYGYGYGYAYGYDDTPTAEPQSGWKKILKYLPIKRV